MNKIIKPISVAVNIWFLTSVVFGAGWLLYSISSERGFDMLYLSFVACICATVASSPVLLVLVFALPLIKRLPVQRNAKVSWLVILSFICTLPYGLLGGGFFIVSWTGTNYWSNYLLYSLASSGVLFGCS